MRDYMLASINIDTRNQCSQRMWHAQHKQNVKHKNKHINADYTELNREYNTGKTTIQTINEAFADWKEERNKTVRKDRQVHSMNEWFKSKKNWVSNDMTIVMTLGNQEEQATFETGGHIKALRRMESKVLDDYAQSFNDRHTAFKLIKSVTNVDESTPHVHMQIVKVGHTKKGTPSTSLNACLREEYGYDLSPKEAMKRFNETEKQALNDAFEKSTLQNVLDTNPKYHAVKRELKRVHQEHVEMNLPHGVSEEAYEEVHKQIKELQAKREEEQVKIDLKLEKQAQIDNEIKQQQEELDDLKQRKQEKLDEFQRDIQEYSSRFKDTIDLYSQYLTGYNTNPGVKSAKRLLEEDEHSRQVRATMQDVATDVQNAVNNHSANDLWTSNKPLTTWQPDPQDVADLRRGGTKEYLAKQHHKKVKSKTKSDELER